MLVNQQILDRILDYIKKEFSWPSIILSQGKRQEKNPGGGGGQSGMIMYTCATRKMCKKGCFLKKTCVTRVARLVVQKHCFLKKRVCIFVVIIGSCLSKM